MRRAAATALAAAAAGAREGGRSRRRVLLPLRRLGGVRHAAAAPGPAAAEGDDDGLERHRARYREAMRTLGATALPPMGPPGTPRPAGQATAAAAAAAAAPPLTPQQVQAAAALPDGEAICRDAALAPSLSLPALLFLAELFWTGLVVEQEDQEEGQGQGQGSRRSRLEIPPDQAKAARLWREAVDRFGDRGATFHYAQCLLHGQGVPENQQQAEQLLTRLAGEGAGASESASDPRACYSLAVLLAARLDQGSSSGGGTSGSNKGAAAAGAAGRSDDDADAQRVYRLLKRAVAGGVLPAVHNLANLLARGHGPRLPRDDAAALALYEQGAALGDPWSTFTLGSWLCQGRGGEAAEEDWERGFRMHLKAAEAFGMPQAAFNVGTHYFSGRGVEQDMDKAAAFFGKAAAAGMTQGMVNLGNMYLEGLVVPPPSPAPSPSSEKGPAEPLSSPLEAARAWYRRAAEAGDPAGRECLAKCDALEREAREAAAAAAAGGKGK